MSTEIKVGTEVRYKGKRAIVTAVTMPPEAAVPTASLEYPGVGVGSAYLSDLTIVPKPLPAGIGKHEFETEGRQDQRTETPCAICGQDRRAPLHR